MLGETVGGSAFAGQVHVLYGTQNGLSAENDQIWHQNSGSGDSEIAETAEGGDSFGTSFAVANLGKGGKEDLVVGASNESNGEDSQVGVVHVIYGGTDGLTGVGDQLWSQDTSLVGDSGEEFDRFGQQLGAANFDGSGPNDLVVGVNSEDLGAVQNAGLVHVLYGGTGGLSAAGSQMWHQDVADVLGVAEESDGFGVALTRP